MVVTGQIVVTGRSPRKLKGTVAPGRSEGSWGEPPRGPRRRVQTQPRCGACSLARRREQPAVEHSLALGCPQLSVKVSDGHKCRGPILSSTGIDALAPRS